MIRWAIPSEIMVPSIIPPLTRPVNSAAAHKPVMEGCCGNSASGMSVPTFLSIHEVGIEGALAERCESHSLAFGPARKHRQRVGIEIAGLFGAGGFEVEEEAAERFLPRCRGEIHGHLSSLSPSAFTG